MSDDTSSAPPTEQRRLAAIMFTDIVGFSRQMGADEARMLRLLAIVLTYIYGDLGREREAQAEGAEILRLSPNFSLEGWQKRFPHRDPAVVERSLAALRKAGLK